jgi:hypothetical protein
VFKSADPDYFISHVNITRIKASSPSRRSRVAYAVSAVSLYSLATCALPHVSQPSSVSSNQRLG